MRKLLSLLFVVALGSFASCGDDANTGAPDQGAPSDLGVPADQAAPGPLAFCLDRPEEELPRPPTDTLPCELIPPP